MKECEGKKFGHDFKIAGGDCFTCGVNQKELSYTPKKVSEPKEEIKEPTFHSEIQYIASQFKEHYPKESFGLFCGIVKRKGKNWSYGLLSEIKEYKREKKSEYPIQFVMKKLSTR